MNSTARIFSTQAIVALTGFGMMSSSSTESVTYKTHYPSIEYNKPIIADQTATSGVKLDIYEMLRIGETNYIRLQEISQLKPGWDGYKAHPIPVSVITRTKDLLMTLPRGAQIFPTGRRTVQIEYHKGADDYFEIEVSAKTFEIFSVRGEDEFENRVYKRKIKGLVEAFLA